jgi:hypothetical protein
MFVARQGGLADVIAAADNARLVGSQQPARTVGPIEDFHKLGDPGEPTLQNGWFSAFAGRPVGYQKAPSGEVYLFGHLYNNAAPGGVHTIFTLPDTHRPTRDLIQGLAAPFFFDANNYVRAVLYLNADGSVRVDAKGLIDGSFSRYGLFLSAHHFSTVAVAP